MAEREQRKYFSKVRQVVLSRAGLAILVAGAAVAGVIAEFPGIQKVFGQTTSAIGEGLHSGYDDFKRTGGFDLISVPPNGVMAIRRSSSIRRLSEEDLIKAAMKRVGEDTGCSIGSIVPILGEEGDFGVRSVDGYLLLTACK